MRLFALILLFVAALAIAGPIAAPGGEVTVRIQPRAAEPS